MKRIVELFSARACSPQPCPAFTVPYCEVLFAEIYGHLGDCARALTHVDRAIAHTPTMPELYLLKAKLYDVRRARPLAGFRASRASVDCSILVCVIVLVLILVLVDSLLVDSRWLFFLFFH